jgi:lipopolysaccharide/colanic/teichoic acid biosynthesis glycosyltransferase
MDLMDKDYIPNDKIVNKFNYKVIKKLIDFFGSFILILLFIPIYIIISILIKITSKGTILYQWKVIGKNGVPFKSWKFRTMLPNADEMKIELYDKNEMIGPVFKMENDPRITKIGKFLRKYSLDESIQFISVLKGDMSLVGPRPAGPIELENYQQWQKRRLSVIPGVTGPWQVSGRNKINHFDEWVNLDLKYIDNWSNYLDIKILIKTIPAAFKGTGV